MAKIKTTLQERANNYGSFEDNSIITQALFTVLEKAPNFNKLSIVHKEAYRMILHKIARSVCGNPNYIDNIHDIAGYALLLEDYLIKQNRNYENRNRTNNKRNTRFYGSR